MKERSQKITELVATVSAYIQGSNRQRRMTHPERDWFVILFTWKLAALSIVSWSAMVYMMHKSDDFVTTVEPPSTSLVYRAERVNEALATMVTRSEERERILLQAGSVRSNDERTEMSLTEEQVSTNEDIPLDSDSNINDQPLTSSSTAPAAMDQTESGSEDPLELPPVDSTPIFE